MNAAKRPGGRSARPFRKERRVFLKPPFRLNRNGGYIFI
jgi:hypothetical protein